MKSAQAAVRGQTCLDCKWCQRWVDPYGGSHYACLKTSETVPSAIVGRKACRLYEPSSLAVP